MKALSIRQPWAWMILHAGKDVENRDWRHNANFHGNLLIHAAKGMSKKEYTEAVAFARGIGVTISIPGMDEIRRGGIVGIVEVTGHKRMHASPWFTGPTALILRNPYPLPFRPYAGQLGFFEVT